VLAFNQAAAEIMTAHKVPVNNLYEFAFPRLSSLQRPVNVHFTDEGSAALAGRVAFAIRTALTEAE
jgi:acyl-CoA thioesterase-1